MSATATVTVCEATIAAFGMAAFWVNEAIKVLRSVGQTEDNGYFGTIVADLQRIANVCGDRTKPQTSAQPVAPNEVKAAAAGRPAPAPVSVNAAPAPKAAAPAPAPTTWTNGTPALYGENKRTVTVQGPNEAGKLNVVYTGPAVGTWVPGKLYSVGADKLSPVPTPAPKADVKPVAPAPVAPKVAAQTVAAPAPKVVTAPVAPNTYKGLVKLGNEGVKALATKHGIDTTLTYGKLCGRVWQAIKPATVADAQTVTTPKAVAPKADVVPGVFDTTGKPMTMAAIIPGCFDANGRPLTFGQIVKLAS